MKKSATNTQHDSNSDYQKELEKIILKKLNLMPFPKTDGFEIDGYAIENDEIICLAEVYVSLGSLSTGGRRKILTDILKLMTFKKLKNLQNVRLIIILTSKESYETLSGGKNNSWVSKCIELYEIELVYFDQLTNEQNAMLSEVRNSQAKGIIPKDK
jgi:hypothetical protein